jgi:hypothetical protein
MGFRGFRAALGFLTGDLQETPREPGYRGSMLELRARRVVDRLRERGIPAHLHIAAASRFGVRVSLPDGREAIWDADGAAALDAQIMRNGMLVGLVPDVPGSEHFTEEQVVDAIARADYDQPVGRLRSTAPPPEPSLPVEGGFFRRMFDGFRYR